ncbi:MAG: twin-arginine translocase TatA/TatE family subunit [Phycisphaerales bacterium]|nr:twin-arginine translocase TatA/TatE family subunit [Phycisphaerales bacterium]
MDFATLGLSFPSGPEMWIILAIGLLLFGKRLPEVGRSLGKGIVEFKKGLKDIGDDVKTAEKAGETPKTIADQPKQQIAGDDRRVSQVEVPEQSSPTVEPHTNG